MINFLLDNGVNLIDTAGSYPGSEEFLGQHLMNRRKDFILVSKCGPKFTGLPGEAGSYEMVSATVDRALKRLQTERIDIMLINSLNLEIFQRGDAVRALVDARRAGKVAHIGLSGDNELLDYAATLNDIEVVETSINIVDQRNIDLALPICRQHNVGVLVKRPIGNACWKDLSEQGGIYQKYVKGYSERFSAMALTPADLGFEGDPLTLWPQIALRFSLFQPGVHVALSGTTRQANAQANLRSAQMGPLPQGVIDKIRSAFHQAQGQTPWPALT